MSVTPTNYYETPFAPGMRQDTFNPDQLIGGDMKIVTDTVTITGAAAYVRGTVLGKVTTTGAYKIALSASNDGSQTPVVILVDNVDATSADVLGGIYLQGEFNINAITLGTGITAAAAKAALQSQKIYLKSPISAADPT